VLPPSTYGQRITSSSCVTAAVLARHSITHARLGKPQIRRFPLSPTVAMKAVSPWGTTATSNGQSVSCAGYV